MFRFSCSCLITNTYTVQRVAAEGTADGTAARSGEAGVMAARLLRSTGLRVAAAALGSSSLLSVCAAKDNSEGPRVLRQPAGPQPERMGAPGRVGEKQFSWAEVQQADGQDGRPAYFHYKGGVYDVTEFQHRHPGGKLIEQAMGGDVEPFWAVWYAHHLGPNVKVALEELRIGALRAGEGPASAGAADPADHPYGAEPVRARSEHTIFSERPFCTETPNDVLKRSYITPASALYVRNHAPVPECGFPPLSKAAAEAEVAACEVAISCEGGEGGGSAGGGSGSDPERSVTVKLGELEKRFGTATVTSVMQCSGNRASEDEAATGPNGFTNGPFAKISQGMLGNVRWSGARLADVLPAIFPKECEQARYDGAGGDWHVEFHGADDYYTSTPLLHILDSSRDCLLATRLNGEVLTPDHGYPVRAVLPGITGARNVKWVDSISVCRKPSASPWNAWFYRSATGQHLQALPMQSLILSPLDGDQIDDASTASTTTQSAGGREIRRTVSVQGVAFGGGTGNPIEKVELSTDGGRTWIRTTLLTEEAKQHPDDSSAAYGWVRFVGNVEVNAPAATIVSRATDSKGNVQPEVSVKQRGYFYNGWGKVKLTS
jgi:sulfite oxidase